MLCSTPMVKSWHSLWVVLFFCNLFLSSTQAETEQFSAGTPYQVCFTPGGHCTREIVDLIRNAQKTIYLQVYTFTSHPISKALVAAAKRGVLVRVIADKSQFDPTHFSVISYLMHHKISVWEDDTVNIAHNKVMVVDEKIVQTGSFNYTNAAQRYNAENVLVISSSSLAKRYLENWYRRERVSKRVVGGQRQN